MSIDFMSHDDFKKWSCHPVDLKGQGPCPAPAVQAAVQDRSHIMVGPLTPQIDRAKQPFLKIDTHTTFLKIDMRHEARQHEKILLT